MKRKLTWLVLLLLVALSLPTAMATDILNDAEYPIVKEPITLKLFSVKHSIQGEWEKMPFWTEMEAKTGIHWEFDLVNSDALNERKSVLLASGDYPDVIMGANITADEELNYGGQGIFVPLQDMIEKYMPNLNAFFTEHPEYRSIMTAADGNIYTLLSVTLTPRDVAQGKLWINTDWLKAVGKEIPKTLDEYYEVLKAFKEGDPNGNGIADEIPLGFAKDGNTVIDGFRCTILPALGIVANTASPTLAVDEAGKVFYIYSSEQYKAYLSFVNKLYTGGLIDAEAFSQTGSQLVAKGNQTLVGSFGTLASYLVDTMDHYTSYSAIPPMTSELNSVQMWNKNIPGTTGVFAITSACKYPEAVLRWADYFYSFEGGAFLSQGPEGLGWKYDNAERTLWSKNLPEGYASTEEYRGTLTPNCGTTTPGYVPREFLLGLNAAHVLNLEANVAAAYTPYLKDGFPRVKLSVDDQNEIAVLAADIDKYVKESEARFITGDLALDKYGEYVANLKKMNIDRYVEIYQGAYDAYMAK